MNNNSSNSSFHYIPPFQFCMYSAVTEPASLAMKRSFPWDNQIDVSSSPNSIDALMRRAEMYQDYMKQIPIPNHRGSVIPFTSWMGLGRSMKQLYGQPLHYLTNILLKQWDQLRIGSEDEYKPLDIIIHPHKAEANIWLIEEIHRQTSSHFHIASLWKVDSMYSGFVDPIFPRLQHTS